MNRWQGAEFGYFFSWNSVAEEVAASDLWPGQIFEQVWLTQRWMKLDVKMELAVITTVCWGVVQGHDVGKRHLPQIIEANEHRLQHGSKIDHFR